MGKKYDKQCKGGEDCYDVNHLCKIAKRGDIDLIRKLVADAKFVCGKCGRAANNEINLCIPMSI